MILGILLLFVGSVTFAVKRKVETLPVPIVNRPPVATTTIAKATADVPNVFPVSRPVAPSIKEAREFGGALSAAAAVVLDDQTNAVLFQKNAEAVRPLASISKLMSALVLIDLPIKWDATITVAESDLDSSSHQISAGEVYTMEDLWHIALIGSSNSAIHALVRGSAIGSDLFVEKMNQKARTLGLASLHFAEPTGLDNRNVGNALDTARLLKAALKVDKIYHTLQIGEYYAHPIATDIKRRVWTTNWLLTNWVPNRFDKSLLVGKTGYITSSGYNFSVRITSRENHAVRVVVFGAASNESRFTEAKALAEWAFSHYAWNDSADYTIATP